MRAQGLIGLNPAIVVRKLREHNNWYYLAALVGLAYLLFWVPNPPILVLFGLIVVLAGVITAYRLPVVVLSVTVLLSPNQRVLVPWLWSHGLPAALARPITASKELAVIAIGMLTIRTWQKAETKPHLDAIDKLGLAMVGLNLLYMVIPGTLLAASDPGMDVKLVAARNNAIPILLMLLIRRVNLTQLQTRVIVVTATLSTVIVGAGAIWHRSATDNFVRFVNDTSGVLRYEYEALGTNINDIFRIFVQLSEEGKERGMSFPLSYFVSADLMLICVGVGLALLFAQRQHPWIAGILLAFGTASVWAVNTRANFLALAAQIVAAFLIRSRQSARRRILIACAAVFGAAIVLPFFGGTRIGDDAATAESTELHQNQYRYGVEILEKHPFGLGLGTVSGADTRFGSDSLEGEIGPDHIYLQVGDEVGIGPMIVFAIFTLLVTIRLLRSRDPIALAAGLSMFGYLIAGQFHLTFALPSGTVPLFALMGLGLARTDRPDDISEDLADQPRHLDSILSGNSGPSR